MRTRLNNDHIFPVINVEQISRDNLERITRIIYFEEWATLVDKESKILKMLESQYNKVNELLVFENFRIYIYTKNAPVKHL